MTVQELRRNGNFQPLLMLRHDELLPFIQEQMRNRTWTMRGYFLLNFVLVGFLVWQVMADVQGDRLAMGKILQYFVLGTFLVFTLFIPCHEGIHGLAYKIVGAPKVSFGANWRKFYFYAIADQFVASRKVFIFIALAPFVVLSAFLLCSIGLASPAFRWLWYGALLMHTGACVGDFAMLSFYEKHRNFSEILTFDDVEEQRSFFYMKD